MTLLRQALAWWGDKFREWFSLDYRSLAVMRMGMGVILLLDLIQRAEDLRAFYSDQGVLPRAQLLQSWNNQWWISLHMGGGSWEFQAVLFAVAGIFALMLIFGYRTQVAIVASWFLLLSLHARNPLVLQGGDVVLRVVIFWMMFMPLGRVWSLDRLFNRTPAPKDKRFLSVATVGYIVQICVLYIFTGLLKTGSSWHADGTAVYYALNVDQLVTPIGIFLREFPSVMTVLTHVTWYVEMYGTLLFFSPVATGFFRTSGILVFALLQIGFNSTMRLGLFGAIAVVSTFGLLPSGFWDKNMLHLHSWIASRGKSGLRIYYDFECTFCYKMSFLIKRFLCLNPQTLIVPAHTDQAVQKIMDDNNSWVVVDASGMTYTGFAGVVAVVRHSSIAWWMTPILSMDFISALGEKAYRYTAEHRLSVCLPEPKEKIPSKNAKRLRALGGIILVGLIVYTVVWNINTIPRKKILPPSMEWIGSLTRLDQQFNMFAPTPLLEDGWYVFPGKLRDGTQINVFTGKSPVSYVKPALVAYTYKNQRWQKYLMNLWNSDYSNYRLGYGQYLCRQWNTSHPAEKQLMTFDIVFMLERTPPPGTPFASVVPTTIWHHTCF